jgi:signal transduction histidine kinase
LKGKAKRAGSFYILVLTFVLAVLVPGIALSMLALRAAERESVYVERRMESSLMAEVDLAAGRVEQLTRDIQESLRRGAEAFASYPDAAGAAVWKDSDPIVETPFALEDGRLAIFADEPSGLMFRRYFGDFLTKGARLPHYDLVTRIYLSDSGPKTLDADVPGTVQSSSRGIERQRLESRINADPSAKTDLLRQAGDDGFGVYARNVAPTAQKQLAESMEHEYAPAPLAQKPAAPQEGKVDAETAADGPEMALEPDSRTVSFSRSFSEIASESDAGLLPYISDGGLVILFWRVMGGGRAAGCTVDMGELRDRIADVLPDIISGARILTVLDESGTPVVTPVFLPAAPDWRRPFAAREISPALPRWEAGAWLTAPDILVSRANYTRTVIWVQVAILASVITAGSVVVIRMFSYEMRVASQKTTFVANVSHELKTPLTSIRLFAELLLSGRQENEERRREYLRTMMSEADRLSHLVGNVLSFSGRREEYSMKPLHLEEVVRDTLAQFEPHLVRQGYSVSCDLKALPVIGNREALKQVVMNLLANAEKYSGDSREISLVCAKDGGFARVDIMDRGIGVDPKLADKIFQEFFRADDSLTSPRGGTGLGLPIARDIARRHGGDVTFSPRPGGGSVFSLSLPLDGG